jgi:hypothetical protein
MDVSLTLNETARYWTTLSKAEQDELKAFDPEMRRSTQILERRIKARREHAGKRVICAPSH